ncbi:helix-turn-helix domain-containing protein [Caballeronia sp. AZ7_KS35]|uniref:IclR family transcriptional regulator n=1 Tax=Caballeronia sp. AZ7_KS35 TaxID=2921762 RepID=UPI002028701D|nr:helix-turn-helix domain-containing protein [Caballeronia sp. AZ7_KS35]
MGNDGVAAVEKALGLLDCFEPGAESQSLSALARSTGMHKTTVYRLLNSLVRMGYVMRKHDGHYSPGHRVFYLGKLFERSFRLSVIVEPLLHDLAANAQESASYVILNEASRLCLFRAEPSEGLLESRLVGTALSLDDSAVSQVFRIWALNEAPCKEPSALPVFTADIRETHVADLAIPVFGLRDEFLAALAVSGSSSRLIAARETGILDGLLIDAAYALSLRLGASLSFCNRFYCRDRK